MPEPNSALDVKRHLPLRFSLCCAHQRTLTRKTHAKIKVTGHDQKKKDAVIVLSDGALSSREADICVLLLDGLLLKEAAFRLGISIHTADYHTRSAYRKLGAHSRVDLLKRFAGLYEMAAQDEAVGSPASGNQKC